MCTMKKKFQMIGFALSVLLVTLPVVTVGADNAASGKQKKEKTTESALGVKPVTGSWINLAYKDVRNKYTNPQSFDNMDPKLWEAKVRELSAMGIGYLVLMEVANEGKSYYPSQIMPWWYNKDKKSLTLHTENNASEEIIWRNGTLLFKSIPLQEIVRQLSNAFHTDIRIEDADLQNYRMTATFSDGETLEEILSLLCRNQKFEYTKTNDIITITQKLN